MRRVFAVAALLVVPGLGAGASVVAGPVDEQLVEGHSVFTVLEVVNATSTTRTEFATAVAVLIREIRMRDETVRFPGVLWWNDQYVVAPSRSASSVFAERYPCSGAVLAVNDGGPDPRPGMGGATYIESYFVTDPNDHAWTVDKWSQVTSGVTQLVWTVSLLGDDTMGGVPDDGDCEGTAYADGCSWGAATPIGCFSRAVPDSGFFHVEGVTGSARQPGANGEGYPCTDCSAIRYNALLYFRLEDLVVAGADKDHRDTVGADWGDVSGCHASVTNEWPCPAGGDDDEGHSHPYNPLFPWAAGDGWGNHGGSTSTGAQDFHATRRIDLYYGAVAPPVARTYRETDTVGSAAPYHCHPGMTVCETLATA